MDFLNGLNNDQTAMLGCAAALLVSGTVMSLSYYVGQFLHGSKQQQQNPEPTGPHTLKMPDPMSLQTASKRAVVEPSIRRAA